MVTKSMARHGCRSVLCLLLALGLFAGCTMHRPEELPQPSSSAQSEQEEAPSSREPSAYETIAQEFLLVLASGDLQNLPVVSQWTQEVYAGKKGPTFSAGELVTLQEEADYYGLYAVELTVQNAGDTSMPLGKTTYHLQVGASEEIAEPHVVQLIPTRPEPSAQDAAVQAQVELLRSFITLSPFASLDEMDPSSQLEYLMIAASREFAETPGEPLPEITQQQVDAMAQKHYGIPTFDGTKTKFYNQQTGLYEIWGRGGYTRYEQFSGIEDQGDTKRIFVDVFEDSLMLIKAETLCYNMQSGGDETYHFVSAERLP